MPIFNFQSRFADLVEAGLKPHTIRPLRKHMPKVGQIAYLYCGLRTSNCRKLGEHPIINVHAFRISAYGQICINADTLNHVSAKELSIRDGFKNTDDLITFFDNLYGLPFQGMLVEWDPNN
jgi:hypothetical protein